MEPTGSALANIDKIWIDAAEYSTELAAAVEYLAIRRMNVSIYNHQLCTLPKKVLSFCRKSISDWKMIYLACCEECVVKPSCAGFFKSATSGYYSRLIMPIKQGFECNVEMQMPAPFT
jgi:hypothetical protein